MEVELRIKNLDGTDTIIALQGHEHHVKRLECHLVKEYTVVERNLRPRYGINEVKG